MENAAQREFPGDGIEDWEEEEVTEAMYTLGRRRRYGGEEKETSRTPWKTSYNRQRQRGNGKTGDWIRYGSGLYNAVCMWESSPGE